MFSMTNDEYKVAKAAQVTLQHLGYTYHGGEQWKPPLGKPPAYLTWDGESRPPVGAETEYSIMGGTRREKWLYAKILYISDEWVIFADDKGVEHCERTDGFTFRRYVSPDELKQKAVQAMTRIAYAPASEELKWEGVLEIIYAAIAAGDIPGLQAIKSDE
jgi:hypothetical protein